MEIQKWNKKDVLFDTHLDMDYATKDFCDVYYVAGQGFCVLNHKPKYTLYARLGIPEIQDIFVLPECRGQGIATSLIRHCESLCKVDMIGISVPVTSAFGTAQRLYARLGYIPDGNGVTYDRDIVPTGTLARADENLCLMLIKDLNPSED